MLAPLYLRNYPFDQTTTACRYRIHIKRSPLSLSSELRDQIDRIIFRVGTKRFFSNNLILEDNDGK